MSSISSHSLQTLLADLGVDPLPESVLIDATNNPLAIFRANLAGILVKLTKCNIETAYSSITRNTDTSNGDLTITLAVIAEDLDPVALIQQFPISALFMLPVPDESRLNVFFSGNILRGFLLPYIHDRGSRYGTTSLSLDPPSKMAIVEFSSPNIWGFESSHLRSTIVGSFVANAYEKRGWKVTRLNYLGDCGKHMGLLAVGWSRFGDNKLFEQDPLHHLLEVYSKIHQCFQQEKAANCETSPSVRTERSAFLKKIEDGDKQALALCTKFREASIEHYEKLYAALDVTFDEYSGESKANPAVIAEVESLLKEEGLYEEKNGSWLVDYGKHGHEILGKRIMRNRTGSATYLLTDLACLIERERQSSFDKMIYVAISEYETHFRHVAVTLELIGLPALAAKIQHVGVGDVQELPRTSDGILLRRIIDECHFSMQKAMGNAIETQETGQQMGPTGSDQIATLGLFVQQLTVERAAISFFNIQNMASLETNSGARLHYWYSKLCSKTSASVMAADIRNLDYSSIKEDEYTDLLRLLAQFPDVTLDAFQNLEASIILEYLFRLVDELSAIMPDEEDFLHIELTSVQLALFHCLRHVLESGLGLIGVRSSVKEAEERGHGVPHVGTSSADERGATI